MLESFFFNKVEGLQACNFIKKRLTQVFSCEYSKFFKNTYFEEHLWTVASVFQKHLFLTFLFLPFFNKKKSR